jgi:hypothetical protein
MWDDQITMALVPMPSQSEIDRIRTVANAVPVPKHVSKGARIVFGADGNDSPAVFVHFKIDRNAPDIDAEMLAEFSNDVVTALLYEKPGYWPYVRFVEEFPFAV